MPTVTLSTKNQITIPAEMVRALGLKAGDKLMVVQVEDHLALFPKPANWTSYFMGSLKGVYGSTREEIDRYVAEERASWGRNEWREEVEDLLATDPVAREVVEVLGDAFQHGATRYELGARLSKQVGEGVQDQEGHLITKLDRALQRLVRLGAVRPLDNPEAPGHLRYRLVRELVRPRKKRTAP